MARSVVLQGTHRCARCELPPRWCICSVQRTVHCPLRVDILQHALEAHRPSSTGNLIPRVLADTRIHSYRRERGVDRAEIIRPDCEELWILHPRGEAPPDAPPPPERLQILLLDANWAQAGGMLTQVQNWGRRVRLPMSGASRYALRAQNGADRFSTFEALLFLLSALGLQASADALRLQFELHVYAGLCSRGRKNEAAAYLDASPVKTAFPELLAEFARRRPADDSGPKVNRPPASAP
ncbi:MAG: DTW domain-containing protein [Verrucomicrobia bacterium]|nr:DTW domain-containing protein [Verrucomicrobiota bacterium]